MSRANASLDLSEFFNNDESDGHRLAEFLQKRRGGVQKQNFLFMNCEPQRLSLNVELEKLPPAQDETCSGNDKQNIDEVQDQNCQNADNVQDDLVENQMAKIHAETPIAPFTTNSSVSDNVAIEPLSPVRVGQQKSPLANTNSSRPASPELPPSPVLPPSPSRPVSPRLKSIRKSCGVSPSDSLRRYSLKRLTRMSCGRRTLLQEFEDTISATDFDPRVCSTPYSQPQQEKLSSPTSIQSPEAENLEATSAADKKSGVNVSCCTHNDTLIRSLQRKDEELKNYMQNIMENTLKEITSQKRESSKRVPNESNDTIKSPLKRIYTIEKGSTPGQVILTPEKNKTNSSCDFQVTNLNIQSSPCKILKTPERSVNRSMISITVKSPEKLNNSLNRSQPSVKCNMSNRGSKILKMCQERMGNDLSQNGNAPNIELPNTPPTNNLSIIFPTQDVEIPETQDVPALNENSILIQSNNKPVVVIPLSQTYNMVDGEEICNNIYLSKTKLEKRNEMLAEKNKEQCNEEDNLKLTDILTDDEEETPKNTVARSLENNSHLPLNLVSSARNIRTKRLRKRSISRRRLQMENSQLLSTETETEPPPQAHTNRRMTKKKYMLPLNRAPGTPLNGEKFAQELARMSNYEILDLRKRNSLGQVYAISGRKTTRCTDQLVKKQLDNEIEMELLRRNLHEETYRQSMMNLLSNADQEIEGPLPAPDEFRDSLTKQHETRNDSRASSLIDEKSTDLISFKKTNSRKQQKKKIPEVLKQYLEVSKKLSQKKKRKKSYNKSKRSLYTQGHESEEVNSSPDKDIISSKNKKQSISCLPSPPKSDSESFTTVKVVSPPPPLYITPRKSLTLQKQHNETNVVGKISQSHETTANVNENIGLPPPPPGFESDSGVSSTHLNIHITSNSTIQSNIVPTAYINTQEDNTNIDENDDQIFKKPQYPAPKKGGRKRKVKDISSKQPRSSETASDSQQYVDSTANTTENSLRRSKRAHKQTTPVFQILFQEVFNKRIEMMEKNRKKQMQKLRQISKEESKNISNKGTIQAKNQTQLETVPEQVSQRDAEFTTKKKTKRILESKVKRKQNRTDNNDQATSNENFESSRLILSTPPPLDHLNNVFEQLRNTSTAPNPGPPSLPPLPPNTAAKLKPFKVRVARLKSSVQPIAPNFRCDSSSSTSNSVSVHKNNNNSNYELISWLKNITESDSVVGRNEEIFKEMRISAASNLSFTELQGVEYAFYDTDQKASLGYLRFKPRQTKPKKKAKRFHLHFVALVGNFRITANDKESQIGVGDMVAIEKTVYYDIENTTDDIGILMVIKK